MAKYIYVVVGQVENSEGKFETQSMEIHASGRIDAEFEFHAETGIGEGITYISAVYGPYYGRKNVAE